MVNGAEKEHDGAAAVHRGRDLLAVALPLRRLRAGPPVHGLGIKGHGLLLSVLPARVADALHAAPHERVLRRQPFTVSPLLDAPAGTPVTDVRPAQWVWLRLTFLFGPMVDVWEETATRELPQRLHLGPGDPGHPPESACPWDFVLGRGAAAPQWEEQSTSYTALLAAPPAHRWQMRFLTPTTFDVPVAPADRARAARGRSLPLPAPDQILRNLAVAWQSWAPAPYHALASPARIDELLLHLQLEESAVTVARAPMGNEARMAFSGEVTLACLSHPGDSAAARAARLRLLGGLLGLAPFSGVGVQTARGMGMAAARALPDR